MLHAKKMPLKIKISENQNPFMGLSHPIPWIKSKCKRDRSQNQWMNQKYTKDDTQEYL